MIGKPEWFARRKYGGWGLMPKTWQGWLYSLILVVITMAIVSIPLNDTRIRISILVIWAVLLTIEIGSIMINIKDEREKLHEAIAERNALWAVILVIIVGVAFQSASSAVKGFSSVDPFLIVAIVFGLIVKAVSNFWLERKD